MQASGEDRAHSESGSQSTHALRARIFAVAASLCLHFVLGFAVIRYGGIPIEPEPAPVLSIGLVPANPLTPVNTGPVEEQETIDDIAIEEPTPELVETTEPADRAELPADPEVVESFEIVDQELAEEADEVELESPDFLPEPEAGPSLVAPSIVTIQNSINTDRQRQQLDSREWANTCSELQRVSGVMGCSQQEEVTYQGVERSPESRSVYEFHNPPRVAPSRSERALPTIASRTGELAASLAMTDIPTGLSEYLMAEVEAGISLYSNQGNLALKNMDLMVDRSEATQMLRMMNDPWVQLRTQQQAAPRYSTRQDVQQSEKCSSPVLLIFTPSEIAECVITEGNFGFLLSPLNFTFDIEY